MGRTIQLQLDPAQEAALQNGAQYGNTPSYRRRCQAILKKAQGAPAKIIAQELDCCLVSVHTWVQRYRQHDMEGLAVQPGRGRPTLLQEQDLQSVKEAVQRSRRRIALALPEIQQKTGKSVSALTLRRTLKKMVDASNDCDA